ncbi:MAG: amidohydrolase family protein [Betaproteobacteria bacterium]|nr:amidohydrolase family protein [Betaproteobacteria bacterium]
MKPQRRRFLQGSAALAAGSLAAGCVTPHQRGASNTLPARGEYLIRGATVLTMDAKLGDFASGDVHVRDGVIVAVGASINAPNATAINAAEMICLPGFIDTHWHLWTSAARTMVRIDVPKLSYFPVTNALGRHYLPEDNYDHVRLGLAEALSAGITTVHNWAHNIRSAEHADAELRAMRDMGVRGRLAYGTPQGLAGDQPMDLAGLAQTQRQWMRGKYSDDGLLSLGICSRNIGDSSNVMRGNISIDMAHHDWGGARKLGLPITMHTTGPSPVALLEEAKLLGADVQLVHPLLTTAQERAIMARRGVSYSISAVGESRRPAAAGVIQLGELLQAGVKCSLSIDHTTTYTADFFLVMRILYNLHQHRVGGKVPLTAKRMIELATIDGAIDLNIAERTGSLTPGKRADLILVRTTDINIAPLAADPYEALLSFGQPRNIDTVLIDGRVLWRGRRFTALDYAEVIARARASMAALRSRAGW